MLVGQKRFVFFTEDFYTFGWAKRPIYTSDALKTAKKTFLISEIREVKLGKKTKNIKRFKRADPDLCFSIVIKNRTIDLQATTTLEYKVLSVCFTLMLRFHQNYSHCPDLHRSITQDGFCLRLFDRIPERIEERDRLKMVKKLIRMGDGSMISNSRREKRRRINKLAAFHSRERGSGDEEES